MIRITPEALPHIHHQVGEISNHIGDANYGSIYNELLDRRYEEMRKHLPRKKKIDILDVGAGMGGIDILLWKHYNSVGGQADIWLLDKQADFDTAKAFLVENGVPAERVHNWRAEWPKTVDLVVALKAWCFHFAPNEDSLLDKFSELARSGARIIADFRVGRSEWIDQMTIHTRLKSPSVDALLNTPQKAVLSVWEFR